MDLMQDVGFNGSGNRFVTRFQAGAPIFASQLNDMTAGLGVIMPQPSVGGGTSTSFTSTGTNIYSLPTGDSGFGLADANPEQFKCRIWTVPQSTGAAKHYLQIANGNVTTVASGFPFTQGDSNPGNGSEQPDQAPYYVTPSEQVSIFDVAVSPIGSRTEGPLLVSPWMASSGTFELDPADEKYYVTVSFFDYNDRLNWYTGNTIFDAHEPWVSIVKGSGPSYNSIFTRCTPQIVTDYMNGGSPASWDPGSVSYPPKLGSDGIMPTSIAYSMKVIARIEWDSDNELWKIRQELVGPITLDFPVICNNLFSRDTDASSPGVVYGTFLDSEFISTIYNFNYIEKFKDSAFTDSDLLNPATAEWWYDVKTI